MAEHSYTDIGSADHDALKKIVAEHPYFSLAHFYLLKQLAPGDAEYLSQAARTALHFNNPFILQQGLAKSVSITEDEPQAPQAEIENSAAFFEDVQPKQEEVRPMIEPDPTVE